MKAKSATPALITCTLFMAIIAGAGSYEHMFGIPGMLSSVNALIETANNSQGQPEKFWIPLHLLSLLTLTLSLICNWKNPDRKKLILVVFIGYIYIWLISIFFARELFAFAKLTDTIAFSIQTKQWMILSWHRPIIGLSSVVLLMIAISRPSKITSKIR